MTDKMRCVGHISGDADPEKFHQTLARLDEQKPNCPWNVDAAETLAKPEERQGWQRSYVNAVEAWEEQ